MKKFNLTRQTALSFLGQLNKSIDNSQSVVFPKSGLRSRTSKFGALRKITANNPMRLTTHGVTAGISKNAIIMINPLNATFGYSTVTIPFGQITIAYDSFFWRDDHGIWRQMKFEQKPGWALAISGGSPLSSKFLIGSVIFFKKMMK